MIITKVFDILLLIALALISARILGYLFHRLKQPVVLGEILAGILLGGFAIIFFSGIHLVSLDMNLYFQA